MNFLPHETWKKILVSAAYTILASLLLYFFLTYIIRYTLPFIISFFIALFLRPLFFFFNKMGMGKRISGFLLTAIVYLGIGSSLFFIIKKVFLQLGDMIKRVIQDPAVIITPLDNMISAISKLRPELGEYLKSSNFTDKVTDRAAAFAIDMGGKIAAIAAELPEITLFIFMMILSTYYFIISFDSIVTFMKTKLPISVSCLFLAGKRHFLSCSKQYFLCIVIMLFITFFELLTGFYLLKIPYALSLAIVISFIDMLPVLGVGTVLIPWAAICMLSGNIQRGLGLVIIYIVVTVVRQIAEPKIIGKGMGIPPLVTLFSMYIGYTALGIGGLIISPFLCGVFFSIIREGLELVIKQDKA